MSDGEYVVWLVNECRAACIPATSRSQNASINISPNSEVEILQRLGKSKMMEFLENQKNKGPMKDKASKKEKKEEAPKLGKLGGFLGHPITAVIRAMGAAKWEFWEARHVFNQEKIDVADNTIRIQLSKGKNGDGEPAPVSKELKDLRPDPSEKPARAAAGTAKNKGKSKQQLVEEEEAAQEEAADKGSKKSKKDKGSKKSRKAEVADEEQEDEPDFEDGQ